MPPDAHATAAEHGIAPTAYRSALGLFASGVTVITATDPGSGEPRGMTANAFMSVSLNPPLVLVSVRRDARLHETLHMAGAYGVSVLGQTLEREARRFAGMSVDANEPPPAFVERGGVPVLRDAMAWVAARIVAAHAAGDHTLFVGEIAALAAERPDEPPLAFHRSAFGRVVLNTPPDAIPIDAWEHLRDWWG